MTLRLHKVTKQIDRLRENAVARAEKRAAALPEAGRAFESAGARADLFERAQKAAARGWDGALLTGREELCLRRPAPAPAEDFTLVAVDGSQVYPDHHGAALFCALNIGYLVLRFGGGASEADSIPNILFDEQDLTVEGTVISNTIVNARRSVEETVTAQNLAARERAAAPGRPVIALMDGGLALRIDEKTFPPAERTNLQGRFFTALDLFAADGIPPAGYISRPGGTPVLALLALALDPAEEPKIERIDPGRLFGGLNDGAFFESILGPGERSAVFEFASFWNNEYQARAHRSGKPSHSVHFFYLNAGRRYPVVARVEIPKWAAEQPALVDRIHAMLVEQSSVTLDDPYPYALIRADEEAFVSGQEKAYLEDQMAIALVRGGLPAGRSEKLAHKGRARKHR